MQYDDINTIIKYDADGHIRAAFKKYGIEGTEQKIKEIMTGQLREFMLARYRKIIDGNSSIHTDT